MNFILFDDERWHHFLPLTHTRPISEIRCGIFTIKEKWEKITIKPISYFTQKYLQDLFLFEVAENNIFINAALFPNKALFAKILDLKLGEALIKNNVLIACRLNKENALKFDIQEALINAVKIEFEEDITEIKQLSDIFSLNEMAIKNDFELATRTRTSQALNNTNTLIGNEIFIEEGAKISASILNTESGPIYIGKNAEIMEGCMIRGPFALGENAVLKMGTKIYGATTIGKNCKVGGEINNSVFIANSNKAHDGFVGNAVIGEWCNLGADTNNSNLKNNYEEVKLWSEYKKTFVKTGLQFCGLIMGDHSKCGINTMFNTGTVVGVSCNIFGAGFPRNFVPSFSWGGAQGFTEYKLNKALETIEKVFERRAKKLEQNEKLMLEHIFNSTQEQRNY